MGEIQRVLARLDDAGGELVEYTQTRFFLYSFLSILNFHTFVIEPLVLRESWLRVATPLEWGIF